MLQPRLKCAPLQRASVRLTLIARIFHTNRKIRARTLAFVVVGIVSSVPRGVACHIGFGTSRARAVGYTECDHRQFEGNRSVQLMYSSQPVWMCDSVCVPFRSLGNRKLFARIVFRHRSLCRIHSAGRDAPNQPSPSVRRNCRAVHLSFFSGLCTRVVCAVPL